MYFKYLQPKGRTDQLQIFKSFLFYNFKVKYNIYINIVFFYNYYFIILNIKKAHEDMGFIRVCENNNLFFTSGDTNCVKLWWFK